MTSKTFRGIGVSPGLAIGHVHLVDRRRVRIPRYHLPERARVAEVERLERAVLASSSQIASLRRRAQESGLQQVSLLLEAHEMILHDDALRGATRRRVESEGRNAEWALRDTLRDLKKIFDRLEQDFFRERRSDVDIVGDRLLRNLTGDRTDPLDDMPSGAVVVAHDLSPGDTVALARKRALAFVTEVGGRTSHTAIMARALSVPSVLGVQGMLEVAGTGDEVIVDGRTGEVVLRPPEPIVSRYRAMQRRRLEEVRALLADRDLPAVTADGEPILLLGNIEVSQELDLVLSHGGEGIGLYRTEFLELERPGIRGHLDHFTVYRDLVDRLGGRPCTIRTVDVGGDKIDIGANGVAARNGSAAPVHNPALGLRAVRLSLRDRAGFREQLKGILLASAHGPVKLLIPFVTEIEELRAVKAELRAAQDDLVAEGHAFDTELPVGIMVETPAAALLADRLALECDFFAIGTNDLIQYLLATDRGNDEVAYLYRPAHPALLRLVGEVADAAAKAGIPVSVCGEMAADPFYTPLLLGLGVRTLSMNPASIPVVKRMLRRLQIEECVGFASEALRLASADDVERALADRLRTWAPDLFA